MKRKESCESKAMTDRESQNHAIYHTMAFQRDCATNPLRLVYCVLPHTSLELNGKNRSSLQTNMPSMHILITKT